MSEKHLSSPHGVEDQKRNDGIEKAQDMGTYANDLFSFRNVLISAVVLGVLILLLSWLR